MLLASASEAIYLVVPSDRRISATSPIVNMKNDKNSVEAHGMREANIRNSVAVVQYIHWLEDQVDSQNITELKGVEKLRSLQRFVLYEISSRIFSTSKQFISPSLARCYVVNRTISADPVAR